MAEFHVEANGAVLVRSMGTFAWRSRTGSIDPKRELERPFRHILHGSAQRETACRDMLTVRIEGSEPKLKSGQCFARFDCAQHGTPLETQAASFEGCRSFQRRVMDPHAAPHECAAQVYPVVTFPVDRDRIQDEVAPRVQHLRGAIECRDLYMERDDDGL